MRLTFLGTGTSTGVPSIGCGCEVCRSADPRDRRLRTSALVETASTRVLVDCGPDFRQQMLGREFRRIDAVLLTHMHYDHVGGIDDLRPFCAFGDIAVHADRATADALMRTVPYCFAEDRYPGAPAIRLNVVEPHQALRIGDIDVVPVSVMHGSLPILGYRFGPLLYITDMKTVAEGEYEHFRGVTTLVVNALRLEGSHHSHQTLPEAVAVSRRIGAERTFLVHMSHGIGLHRDADRSLPGGISLAFDGQVVEV